MENNIFDYATKELSQDAVVAWLANCYNCSSTKEIGEMFIKKFILGNDYENINRIEIKRSFHRIDIFMKIETDKQKYSIIVENKRKTFLHDKQLLKYVNQIKEEGKKIIVILFKSGNIFPYEELQYEMEQEEIKKEIGNIEIEFKLKDVQSFIDSLKLDTSNIIIKMVIEYYQKIKIDNEKLKANDWKLQISKNEWNEFYNIIISGLKKLDIEESKNENGEVIGIRRPGGLGNQADRSNFEIQNKKFLEKSNKIISVERNIWGFGIDWKLNGQKVILFCNTEFEKRKGFHNFVKNYLEDKDKEIDVVGKRPTFAKIEIPNESIEGRSLNQIAEIIIEKILKLYNSILKCFDLYPNSNN